VRERRNVWGLAPATCWTWNLSLGTVPGLRLRWKGHWITYTPERLVGVLAPIFKILDGGDVQPRRSVHPWREILRGDRRDYCLIGRRSVFEEKLKWDESKAESDGMMQRFPARVCINFLKWFTWDGDFMEIVTLSAEHLTLIRDYISVLDHLIGRRRRRRWEHLINWAQEFPPSYRHHRLSSISRPHCHYIPWTCQLFPFLFYPLTILPTHKGTSISNFHALISFIKISKEAGRHKWLPISTQKKSERNWDIVPNQPAPASLSSLTSDHFWILLSTSILQPPLMRANERLRTEFLQQDKT